MSGRSAGIAASCAVLAACWPRASAERVGDEAYGTARYSEALAAYQDAVRDEPEARLWAKVGASALRVGTLGVAADAYLRLAGEDPTRADEAAEGLTVVAGAAERSGDTRTLQAAVAGLEAVAPERVAGRFTLALARRPGNEPADLVTLLPGAIAAAPDPNTVDSLLGIYAVALRETRGCDAALPVYQAVVRRSRNDALLEPAHRGVAECSEALGVMVPADSTADSISVSAP